MPEPAPPTPRISRESRLLLLTIAICVLVLLVLARVRFADQDGATATDAPLERLAARASYDALAADIQRVESMIAPNLVVLRMAPLSEMLPRRVADVLARPALTGDDLRHVAALRTGTDTALAAMDPRLRLDGIVGGAAGARAELIAVDPVRRVARVRVPGSETSPVASMPLSSLQVPAYVVAVEATQAGVTLRPVFLGRGDRFSSVRWSRPLLPLGGIAVNPGALLFTLSGQFIGCVVVEDGALAVAGSADVLEAIERLAAGPAPSPAGLGIAVQTLTPALAQASGANDGVVVAEVEPGGPADGTLQPADVIVTLDGAPVTDPDGLLLGLAGRRIGTQVTLDIVRDRTPQRVTLMVAAAEAPVDGQALVFVRRGGVTRAMLARSGAGVIVEGLRPDDVIVSAGAIADPSPAELAALLTTRAGDHGPTVFTIRRGGHQIVFAAKTSSVRNAGR